MIITLNYIIQKDIAIKRTDKIAVTDEKRTIACDTHEIYLKIIRKTKIFRAGC